MLRRSILVMLSVIGITFGGAAVLSPATVFAERPQDAVCDGVGAATGSGCSSGITLTSIVRSAIRIFSLVIGLFAVIMIIIAGFRYITANGDSGNITSAKNSLIYALIGLIVAGASQAIVSFVLENVN